MFQLITDCLKQSNIQKFDIDKLDYNRIRIHAVANNQIIIIDYYKTKENSVMQLITETTDPTSFYYDRFNKLYAKNINDEQSIIETLNEFYEIGCNNKLNSGYIINLINENQSLEMIMKKEKGCVNLTYAKNLLKLLNKER